RHTRLVSDWSSDVYSSDLQNRVELGPEAPAVRHKHPGEEIIYVLEGELEYSIDGRPPQVYSAGEALLVPPETVHSVRNVGTEPRSEERRVGKEWRARGGAY